ncbi:PD-(D/E)XK nuclease family protein [Helicobacter cetorum]|uniref:PDDEXK-like family protein n=1 Tax=Helicobacter cetorum TaxID=138563 RepID=UPI000CF08DAA|nr:PD-(D/E)XK nuclease family protein [Helicobacter cetorum]
MSDYQTFFNQVKHALKELEIKRARGLHDYNVFSVLMSESDEVKHSKILHSFLDPMGEHYQKDLFLKAFLKVCHLESFGFNSADTKIVKKEVTTNGSRRMDLFLSDGFKHIILENKINADDNKNQISDYILGVVKDYKIEYAQNLCVLYLTKEERLPSQNSLGDFKIDESNAKLFYKGNKLKLKNLEQGILFKNLCYKVEIKEWVKECLKEVDILKSKAKEVGDLNDFSVIFKQYDKLLDKLYNKEQNMNKQLHKVMREHYTMAKEVAEKVDNFGVEAAKEVHRNFDNFRVETAMDFFKEVERLLKEKFEKESWDKEWEVKINNKMSDENRMQKRVENRSGSSEFLLRIAPKGFSSVKYEIRKQCYTFDFGFLKDFMYQAFVGFRKHEALKPIDREYLKTEFKKSCEVDKIMSNLGSYYADTCHIDFKEGKFVETQFNENSLDGDFIASILNKEATAQNFCEFILDYFNKHKELVEKLNANIENIKK